MQQDAQKPKRKFCTRKTAKKRKTHPIQPEKGETGCVLGAGGDENGWGQVQTDGKTGIDGHRTCLACWLGQLAARGFGVDVGGTQQAAGERQGCAVLPAKSQKSGAGLVL